MTDRKPPRRPPLELPRYCGDRRFLCSWHLVLLLRLMRCEGSLDIRIAKGKHHRGYNFLRVSAVLERPQAQLPWLPSFHMLEEGICMDISYLPITGEAMCKDALERLRPGASTRLWRTSNASAPYGCFFAEHEGSGSGELWMGSGMGIGFDKALPPGRLRPVCKSRAYQAQFFHRWTSKVLHTEVLHVGPAGSRISLGGMELGLQLHPEGQGATGLLIADPCFTSRGGIPCPNGRRFQVLKHLTEVLNVLLGSDEVHFWCLLGNAFYDPNGSISSEFFERLDVRAKLKPLLAVPGNHDFWADGKPPGSGTDPLGYGFMQFYGQDTVAATPALPFNFSSSPHSLQLAQVENFVFGSQIGDMAFFGYSGAHSWRATEPHAARFCRYVGETESVKLVVLLGHWASEEHGCRPGMDVPSVRMRMQKMPGCVNRRLLYFAGHQHCNKVLEHGEGFLLGGAGMLNDDCSEFGFAVIQSVPDAYLGPNARVDYFPIAQEIFMDGSDTPFIEDYFRDLIRCLKARGYTGCRERHSLQFRSLPQPPTTTSTVTTQFVANPLALSPGSVAESREVVPDWMRPDWMRPTYQTSEPRLFHVPNGKSTTAQPGSSTTTLQANSISGVAAGGTLLLAGLVICTWSVLCGLSRPGGRSRIIGCCSPRRHRHRNEKSPEDGDGKQAAEAWSNGCVLPSETRSGRLRLVEKVEQPYQLLRTASPNIEEQQVTPSLEEWEERQRHLAAASRTGSSNRVLSRSGSSNQAPSLHSSSSRPSSWSDSRSRSQPLPSRVPSREFSRSSARDSRVPRVSSRPHSRGPSRSYSGQIAPDL